MEKVAQQAGRAAPAVAIAGALVALPQVAHTLTASAKPVPVTTPGRQTAANAARGDASTRSTTKDSTALDSVATRTVTVSAAKSARHAALARGTTYRVRGGDTLSTLANRFFHNDDWQYLYHENAKTISDPDQIYPGQSLFIPASAPAHYTLSGYAPRHAKPADVADPATQAPVVQKTAAQKTVAQDPVAQTVSWDQGSGSAAADGTAASQSAAQGQYSCAGLEQIWQEAGGSPSTAFMAAEVAMAESGGNPNAISPTSDYGLWQINASNGALATLDPFQNARSAVTLSDDGTDWSAWTTFTSGTYAGRC